jgi:peptide/nickel transport system permease protein
MLLISSIVVFALLRLAPGDPVRIERGLDAPDEQVAAERERLGLHRPLVVQYLDWLGGVARGDFGRSLRSGEPIATEIRRRLPATLELQLVAFVATIAVSVPLGTLAAVKRRSPIATATTALVSGSIAVPAFFFCTLLVYLFTYKLRLFETPRYVPFAEDPWSNLKNLVLPAIGVAYVSVAVYTRFVRSSVLDALSQDYVRTARAKGLDARRVVMSHVLRNALVPIITLLGLSTAMLWTGTLIAEQIFNWPGIGRLTFVALSGRDYPTLQAIVLLSTLTYAVTSILADIAYAAADPRIRYAGRR